MKDSENYKGVTQGRGSAAIAEDLAAALAAKFAEDIYGASGNVDTGSEAQEVQDEDDDEEDEHPRERPH